MIPSNLNEAVEETLRQLDARSLRTDPDVIAKTHHGFGRHIRNSWSLWQEDCPLRQWFRDHLKIGHPDDISAIIMEASVAKTKGEEYDPAPSVQRFHEHWERFGCNNFGESHEPS